MAQSENDGAKRDIEKVLMTITYREAHHKTLCDALAPAQIMHVDREDADGIAKALEVADVALLGGDLDGRYLAAPKLKWVHCDHGGLNKSAKPEVIERGLIVTGSAGRAAPALAQHIFFLALALAYEVPNLIEMKKTKIWRGGVDLSDRRCMLGKTIGLIGFGHTAVATAALAKAMGMKVLAYGKTDRPTPDNVDTYFSRDGGDSIDTLLQESDVVTLTIRLTDETYHMIGARELGLMKPSAILINMARGPVVDEAALVKALHDGTIAGAGLDVFEQEPLPPEAPIWDAPNIVMTPHCTAEVPDLQASSLNIICQNINRYRAGTDMLNRLMPGDVYTK